MLQSDQRQQAQDYVIRELGPIYAEWLNRINDFIDYQEASISKGTQGVMERSENFATLMWWITAFAIIAGGLVAWRIVVRLTHRIGGEPEEAAQLADDTDKETVNGSREVEATVRSIEELAKQVESASAVIGELSDNTAEINKVLEVIEGIADQTNLLALNAAIEAARAGEHGRGFSVVADEVRALANRTQDSTRSIQSLIETMRGSATNAVDVMEQGRQKATESVEQARRAGESLQSVNTSVAKMSDMNAQIATAAEEQTAVAEEINQNFTSITEAAEQAAAGSEQISEASRELQELAKRLNNGMKRFKIA
ncbi:methyl-accepting chemotaxis protein [Idiomarina sp.]|uniref:methyl-accepting chemotaxis protein n=1 Tax=Idiomarina sp. TaxID=1874361 RepID=UPI00260A9D09|nr:methyl-accepting chemotaxis protein [Idiomarina sp.]